MRLVGAFLANSLAIYDDLQPGIFFFPLNSRKCGIIFSKNCLFFFFSDFVFPMAFWYSVTKIAQA